jgi:uncharacterized protein YndB with AHSA1/START domain
MTTSAVTPNELTLSIVQEVRIAASLEASFAALLEEIGPHAQNPDGSPLPMKIEPWPGGRWYRDLGDDNGHFWGHVQAIKRPTLLEITGPLFMSYAVVSNLQYRLTPVEGGTLLTLKHSAMGMIPEDHRAGLGGGWRPLLERVRAAAERTSH